jgi:hypothetical protein
MRSRQIVMLCAAFVLGAAASGVVLAADPRLDQAIDNLVKADALLRASTVPPKARDNVRAAIDHVQKAQREIQRAKNQSD